MQNSRQVLSAPTPSKRANKKRSDFNTWPNVGAEQLPRALPRATQGWGRGEQSAEDERSALRGPQHEIRHAPGGDKPNPRPRFFLEDLRHGGHLQSDCHLQAQLRLTPTSVPNTHSIGSISCRICKLLEEAVQLGPPHHFVGALVAPAIVGEGASKNGERRVVADAT